MKSRRPPFARSSAVVLGLSQAVVLLLAVAPRMVWCHKPGGAVAFEFEVATGECQCSECTLCREHDADRPGSLSSRRPSLRAAHCRHDEIRSDAGRSEGIFPALDGAPADPAGDAAPAALLRSLPPAAFVAPSPSFDTGPPGGVLRC